MNNALNQLISKYPQLYQSAKLQYQINLHNNTIGWHIGLVVGILGIVALVISAIMFFSDSDLELASGISLLVGIIFVFVGGILFAANLQQIHTILQNPTWQIYQLMLPQVG